MRNRKQQPATIEQCIRQHEIVQKLKEEVRHLGVCDPGRARANSADFLLEQMLKRLPSGRDKYSRMSRSELTALVPPEVLERICRTYGVTRQEHTPALRWVLRGLPVELALERARIGERQGERIRAARRKDAGWDGLDVEAHDAARRR